MVAAGCADALLFVGGLEAGGWACMVRGKRGVVLLDVDRFCGTAIDGAEFVAVAGAGKVAWPLPAGKAENSCTLMPCISAVNASSTGLGICIKATGAGPVVVACAWVLWKFRV